MFFNASDSQMKRFEALGFPIDRVGFYAADAFEEWLKRRESRYARCGTAQAVRGDAGELDG